MDAERDQGGARECLDRPAESGPSQEVARPGDRDGIEGQPGKREEAEDGAEKDEGPERSAPAGDELRQQAGEEHRHLRVSEIAEETLAKGHDASEAVSRRFREARPAWTRWRSPRVEEHPRPEEDQVARPEPA